MWVKREEWNEVQRRLRELENRVTPKAPYLTVFTGEKKWNGHWMEDEHRDVPIERVVKMMLDALNLTLKYDPPTERVEKKK